MALFEKVILKNPMIGPTSFFSQYLVMCTETMRHQVCLQPFQLSDYTDFYLLQSAQSLKGAVLEHESISLDSH